MEQQDEKRRKIQTQPSSSSSLPLDLISKILLSLPARSINRFRGVSKLWSSIITDPYFIISFKTLSSKGPSLLLCFQEGNKLFFSMIPQYHHNLNEPYTPSSKPIDRYHMTLPESCHFSHKSYPTESVHGLICFRISATPIVWNPSIGRFFTLPKPEKKWIDFTVVLGYDPIEGKHKVVCMPWIDYDECRVSTLGPTQESWRTVKTIHRPSFNGVCQRCINGFIYYYAYVNREPVIMRFDVRFEKLDMIKLPAGKKIRVEGLINYEGRLACVHDDYYKKGITLLILEDAEKHEWLSKEFLAPFHHYDAPRWEKGFKLKGMTPAGEFVYVPNTIYESFHVLFYDPEKNSFRRVEFEFRLSNGIVNKPVYMLHTFLDHIESLISL